MNLITKKTTRNKIVTIELTTNDFSSIENKMLDELGEPVITFDKNYGSNSVKFSKKIRSGFKVKVKFDASLEADTDKTAEYINLFLEELKDKLSEAMYEVESQYNEDLKSSEEITKIRY